MKIKYFIILFVAVLIASCGEKKNSMPVLKTMSPTDSLNVFLGLPTRLVIYEPEQKMFVINLFGADMLINVIDIVSDSILFSFAAKGQGPDEYLSVSNIEIYKENSKMTVGIFDLSANVYRKYDYDSLICYKEKTLPFQTSKNKTNYKFHFLHKTDSGYIATGFFTEGKFALLDTALNIERFCCQYKPKPNGSISDHLNAKANLGRCFLSPDRKFLGNIIYIASVLNLYRIEEDKISPQWEYIINDIDYEVRNENYINTQVEGYMSGFMTDSLIYALYCGRDKDLNTSATYAKELHIFDYNGILTERYDLQRELFDICIDKRNKKMYTITHIPEPKILIYEIP
jgi:hypothetical protein